MMIVHQGLGGIGILTGILLVALTSFGLKFILPIILTFSSGIFEDFHNSLSAKLRLFLQIVAASTAIVLTHAIVTYLVTPEKPTFQIIQSFYIYNITPI